MKTRFNKGDVIVKKKVLSVHVKHFPYRLEIIDCSPLGEYPSIFIYKSTEGSTYLSRVIDENYIEDIQTKRNRILQELV